MAASPTLETVLTAIKAAIDAIGASIGTTYVHFHTFEDDVEFIRRKSLLSNGSANIWFIDCAGIDELEGGAAGEIYEVYDIRILYWSIRTADDEWSKKARVNAEAVRDALSGAASIFAISSQRQLRTPETVRILSHGQKPIRGTDGPQMLYETVLGLQVEARRWS